MDERAALEVVGELVAAAGDDAAVLDEAVLTIDMLHESTDFPEGTTNYTAGWRAVGASLSDIAAMGGEAIATVAVYGAPEFDEEALRDFVEGTTTVSESVGAAYVGGDLDEHAEFTVATAALGRTEQPINRASAAPGDVVCVTGTLGRTAAAMEHASRGNHDLANELLQFSPRVAAGRILAPAVSAMMDSSDGLARSLHQLAEASQVGFAVDRDSIPVAAQLRELGEAPDEALDRAVQYGEDFELVCTMPESEVEPMRAELAVPLSVIGRVTGPDAGIRLDDEPLPDAGFTHGR